MLSLLIKRHSQAAAATVLSPVLFYNISSSFLWLFFFPSPGWSVISYPSVLSYRPHVYRQWERQNNAVQMCCKAFTKATVLCLRGTGTPCPNISPLCRKKRAWWYLCISDRDSKTHLLLCERLLNCSAAVPPATCSLSNYCREKQGRGEISVEGRKKWRGECKMHVKHREAVFSEMNKWRRLRRSVTARKSSQRKANNTAVYVGPL